MDGLSLSAVVQELNSIIGGRIEKVQQPEKDELLIAIHAAGGSYRLLISASPENCRIVLTNEKKQSPVDAPAFLMLMRKYLTGARIVGIEQPNMDRVAELELETVSELHDKLSLRLICEIMGRHSNIILVDSDGNVIDSIRRVNPSVSSARLVLPRVRYEYPPSKVKRDPRSAEASDFLEVLENAVKPESALSENFYGLSPAVAKKLIASLGGVSSGAELLSQRIAAFYADFAAGRYFPCIETANGSCVCTLPFKPEGASFVQYGSMSEAVTAFYSTRAAEESVKRRTSSYERAVKNAIQKLERKLGIYTEAIQSEEEIEKLRLYGELLTSNLYLIPQRASSALVYNYYADPPAQVEVPLDPMYSAADNAQRYYTKYRKAKLARDHALEMREKTAAELSYLEELLYTLSCCEGESELGEIRSELIAGGYITDDAKKQKRGAAPAKLPPSKPYAFVSRDGINILVGKNNRQNDKLTFGIADPDDTWLHTKDIHGSHVIIKKGGQIPDSTLYDASMLAAYYSKARGSSNVPVDFTLAKYVKKPSGAKPGMVIYTHQRTVYVTPDLEHVKLLMK